MQQNLYGLALGIGGCASNGASAATETRQRVRRHPRETTEADTRGESAADNVEDMNGQDALQSLRIYGPVTKQEGWQAVREQPVDMVSAEIILNVSEEYTYILDAVTGPA